MQTMRAIRYHGPRTSLTLETIDRPGDPGPGEALIRIRAAGVCHTELHFLRGILDLGIHPMTLGHEIAGTVEKLGPGGVRGIREGDRVIAYYYLGCGECGYCRTGEENLCGQPRQVCGFAHDGGFAEYVKTAAVNLIPLPDGIPFEEAAPIGCSVATGVHAIARGGLKPGEWAVVYGTGAVGFGLIQLCAAAGARVIAVGRNPRKLDVARSLGAEAVLQAPAAGPAPAVAESIRDLTGGRGADLIFELVGSAETMPQLIPSLAKHGRVVFIGYTADSFTLSPLGLVLLEGTVTASVGNTRKELRRAVDLVAQGKVRIVVDRVEPFDRVQTIIDDLEAGTVIGRAVLQP